VHLCRKQERGNSKVLAPKRPRNADISATLAFSTVVYKASQKSNGCIWTAAKLQTKLTCSKQPTSGLKQRRSKMDEARCEEASQNSQQQQCILSGEVYLRHRSEKRAFQKSACSAFPISVLRIKWSRSHAFWRAACWRAGVQEAILVAMKPYDTLCHLDIINKSKI
jgi:hypothetical protein